MFLCTKVKCVEKDMQRHHLRVRLQMKQTENRNRISPLEFLWHTELLVSGETTPSEETGSAL